MKISFVIDNREHTLADVPNDLLNQLENRSIDMVTASFTVRGFQLIKGGLENIGRRRVHREAQSKKREGNIEFSFSLYSLCSPRLCGEILYNS